MGEHPIVIAEVRHVDIHSSRFLDLVYTLERDTESARHVVRIGPECVLGEVGPGTRCLAQFVMRQIVGVRPSTSP